MPKNPVTLCNVVCVFVKFVKLMKNKNKFRMYMPSLITKGRATTRDG